MENKCNITFEKIESSKIDKARKVLLFCGIGLIIISVIQFLTASSTQLTGIGWWFDTLLIVILPIYFLVKTQKIFIKRSGQFIEWTIDSIIFKLKNETAPVTIPRDEIFTINIHLDTIEIVDKKGQNFRLDISDFDKYEDRLKIKTNFEKESNLYY